MIKELVWVFLLGAFPIAELRGAMPLGIFVFKLPPLIVYLVAVLGNFLIVPLLLIFLKHFSAFLMRKSYFFNRFLNYIFSRTRDHHFHKFERLEHWMLFALVAIPFPLTVAWTACVSAGLDSLRGRIFVRYFFQKVLVCNSFRTYCSRTYCVGIK
jgi:uncharacterized membrane protein